MNERIRELENRIKEIEIKIENCKIQKKNIETNSRKLKSKYDIGELSYEDYETSYKRLFGDKTPEQWISYYNIQLKTYQAQHEWCEKELKKEIKSQKKIKIDSNLSSVKPKQQDLFEKIKKAESNKKEIISKMQTLASQYNSGEISYNEYQKIVKEKFGDKTPQEWVDYYDNYIVSCKKILNQNKQAKNKIKKIAFTSIVILALLIPIFLLLYSDFSITGRTVELVKETHTDNIEVKTSESTNYEWTLENLGKLNSVRVSGEFEGKGNVKIYLDDILILDSDNFVENGPLTGGIITGFNTEGSENGDGSGGSEGDGAGDRSSPEGSGDTGGEDGSSEGEGSSSEGSGSDSGESSESSGDSNGDSDGGSGDEGSEDGIDGDNGDFETGGEETKEEGSDDSGEEESTEDETNETEQGNKDNKEEEQEDETQEEVKVIAFNDVCEETCNIAGLNLDKESYNLRIEVSNAKLKLEKIKYEIEKPKTETDNKTEEIPVEPIKNITEPLPDINITNETAPVLIKQIPSIFIEKNNYYDLGLSNYFENADTFFLLQIRNITTTSFDHTIRIQPDENFTGNREVKIIAQNEFGNVESNLFDITVTEFAEAPPQLIKEIPQIIILKNNQTEIKLEEYFLNVDEFFFLQTQNISTTTYDHTIVLVPEENFTGTRTSKIIASNKFGDIESNFFNITIIDSNITEKLNETKNETGNVSISTLQYKAVINKPTKWIKTVNATDPEDLKEFLVEIPKESENISILPGEGDEEAQNKVATFENDIENADKEDIVSGVAITGNVAFENSDKKGILTRIWEFITRGGITGRVVDDNNDTNDDIIETEEGKFVNLTSIAESTNASEINIEYITPGPEAIEQNTSTGKKVFVAGDDALNFTDILAFAEIPEIRNVGEEKQIKILWIEQNVFVNFSTSDLDGNGKIDYVEWIVPHLSNQTFQIIVITKAEHLDENRTFISDIYDEVFTLDGNWSETIPNAHYVRVTFEANLTSVNDITIFPRTINGTPRIEVYEFNQTELIAEFVNITDNQYNKIYLTNLTNRTQDTFDLLVLNGSVEFDHIIDPTINLSVQTGTGTNVTIQSNFSHLAIGSNTESVINTSNLFLYHAFDANVSNVNLTFDYANYLNGTYQNGAYYNDTGIIGGAVVLDGINDYVQIGGGADKDIAENWPHLTVSLWFKKDQADILSTVHLLDKTGASADTFEFIIGGNDRVQFRAINSSTGGLGGGNADSAVANTNWHHAVGVYNGVNVTLYLDGSAVSGVASLVGLTSTSNNNLTFGTRSSGTGNNFNGTIDEVMILNASLTPTQINDLFKNQTSRFFSRGEQIINNVNVSSAGTENYVNITINSTTFKGSMINVSVGDNTSNSYSYGSEYAFTNNFISSIPVTTPNNISLKFIFYAGNTSQKFYTPTLENTIQVNSYTIAAGDTTTPVVNLINPTNGTVVTSSVVFFAAYFTDNSNVTNATLYIWNSSGHSVGTNFSTLGNSSIAKNLSFTLPRTDTYFWNYEAFDNSTNSAFNNSNYTLTFDQSVPYLLYNSPANHSIFLRDVFNISLNTTVRDDGGQTMNVFVYGIRDSNISDFYKHGLLYQKFGVANNSEIFYNWTAPVIIPDASTVLLLHLDNRSAYGENQTRAVDFSNYANNGTTAGSARPNVTGGYLAGGWEFDGASGDNKLTIPHNSIYNVSQLTIALWIKPYNSKINNGFLLSKDGQSNTGFTFQIDYITNTTEFSPDGSIFNNSDNNVFTRNNWTHIAVTANTTTVNFYINGVLNKTHTGSYSFPNNTNSLAVAGSSQGIVGEQGFNGTMDELAFYNRSLADYEIRNLYRLDADKYFWKVNLTDSNSVNNESAERDIIVRGPHIIVEKTMTCSDLSTHVKNIEYGYSCSNPNYATCIGLNSALNITSTGILTLPSSCQIFFNSSTDGQYSLFVEGNVSMTGANLTGNSSGNKFNFTALAYHALSAGASGNLSFANFIRQTNITDSKVLFTSVDIENILMLLNSTDITSYTIAGGTLDRRFRLNVTVYADGAPVSSANVTARNVSGNVIFSTLSGSDGSVLYNLTQYRDTGGGKIYWTNYTINVTKTGYKANSTLLNLTADANLSMYLTTFSIIEVSTTETLHDIFTRVGDSAVFGNLSDGTRTCRYVSTASINVTSSGKLIMESCTLEMNSTIIDGQYDIEISGILQANYSNFTKASGGLNYEFYTSSTSNTTITNSYIFHTGKSAAEGIRGLVLNSNNVTFKNNTLSKAIDANLELRANSIEIVDSLFLGGSITDYNIFVYANNSKIINSNVSGAESVDIIVQNYSNFTVLNSNYSTHNILGGGFIYRQWYVDAKVNDTAGNNLTNANVSFYNNSGSLVISALTNSSGDITRQNVTEYYTNNSIRYYQTNYTINATKLGYNVESQLVNLTTSKTLIFSTLSNAIPTFTLNTLNNASLFQINQFNKTLNVTAYDNNSDLVDIYIYGVNNTSTASFYKHGLIAQRIGVSNGTQLAYNWTAPVIVPEVNTVLLLHLDNRSAYGENQTLAVDFSNYGNNNGTLVGNARPNMSGGYLAGGWEFDGVGQASYLNIPSSASLNVNGNITIVAWIKPYSGGSEGYIASKDSDTTNGYFFKINYTSNATEFGSNNDFVNASDANLFIRNGWTHVAVVANTTTVIFYKNGIANKTHVGSYSFNVLNTNTLRIGATNDPGASGGDPGGFNGTLDELAIYNRTLSATEILDIYRLNVNRYYWKVNITDQGAGNTNESETREFNITDNQAPTVNYVSPIAGVNPTEGSTTSVSFKFTASDAGGTFDLDSSTAKANFSRTGEELRQNSSCIAVSGETTSTTQNYSCTVLMYYYDAAGTWNVTASIADLSGVFAKNDSTNFTYNQLQAIVISPSSLSWSTFVQEATNQTSNNDPSVINNTGNYNAASITVTALNLHGESVSSEYFSVGNFTVDIETGGSPPAECLGTTMSNGTAVAITGATLNRGNNSVNDGSTGQEQFYYCITNVPSLSSQTYSTSYTAGAWKISILAVAFGLRKKRKKKSKKELLNIFDNLDRKYKLEIERLLNAEKIIEETYGVSVDDLLETARIKKTKESIFEIPIEIFSGDISPAEALCKYLKEEKEMRFSEIARLINRDQRTVWISYRNASLKETEFKIKNKKATVSIEIFSNRKTSILESLIYYLREHGLNNTEIAHLLDKDPRNTWTIYSRAVRKKSVNTE